MRVTRVLGYEAPLFETDTGRVRVQLWGHMEGERRNVVAHCDVRTVKVALPSVPINECTEIAMRSALAKALELGISTEARLTN